MALAGETTLVGFSLTEGSDRFARFEPNENSWEQTGHLVPSTEDTGTGFGFAVTVEGSQALVGAPGDRREPGRGHLFGL